jgi:hypothetical protein
MVGSVVGVSGATVAEGVGSGSGGGGVSICAVGLNVDNGATSGIPAWVGGSSSDVQPSKMRMVKIAMVQAVISGLNGWLWFICLSCF